MTDEEGYSHCWGSQKGYNLLIASNFHDFAGSLRAGSYDSYDKALLSAAVELLPDGAALEIFNLSGIPPLTRILGAIWVQK